MLNLSPVWTKSNVYELFQNNVIEIAFTEWEEPAGLGICPLDVIFSVCHTASSWLAQNETHVVVMLLLASHWFCSPSVQCMSHLLTLGRMCAAGRMPCLHDIYERHIVYIVCLIKCSFKLARCYNTHTCRYYTRAAALEQACRSCASLQPAILPSIWMHRQLTRVWKHYQCSQCWIRHLVPSVSMLSCPPYATATQCPCCDPIVLCQAATVHALISLTRDLFIRVQKHSPNHACL